MQAGEVKPTVRGAKQFIVPEGGEPCDIKSLAWVPLFSTLNPDCSDCRI
jgi:hypothetical protein